MYEEVGALSAAAGIAATPALMASARWAPGVGRPEHDPDAHGRPSVVVVAGISAVALGLVGGRLGLDAALPAYLVFALVSVVLLLVDVAWHRLPDVLVLPSYVVGIVLLGGAALAGADSGGLRRAFVGAAVGFLAYGLLYLAVRAGIGAGDVKYAGLVGLHAGWLGWGSLAVALVAGFVVGGLVSVVLLATRRARLTTRFPFGPAMVVGAVIGIGWGEPLAAAWLGS